MSKVFLQKGLRIFKKKSLRFFTNKFTSFYPQSLRLFKQSLRIFTKMFTKFYKSLQFLQMFTKHVTHMHESLHKFTKRTTFANVHNKCKKFKVCQRKMETCRSSKFLKINVCAEPRSYFRPTET